MIVPALMRQDEVQQCFARTWHNEKYKYFYCGRHFIPEFPTTEDCTRQLISIDNYGNILGYISYDFDLLVKSAHSFGLINFGSKSPTFSRDMLQVVDDIFMKYNFNKMNYRVVSGNPIEGAYRRLCEQCNGRIAAVFKDDVWISDNTIHDCIDFEIMRSDYIQSPMFQRLHTLDSKE